MDSPLVFKNVPYRVAGSSLYIGDLIITEQVIYFFPQKELAAQIYKVGYVGLGLYYLLAAIPVLMIAPAPVLQEAIKSIAGDVVKEGVIKPHTKAGRLEREEAAKELKWMADLEASYPKALLQPEQLYPIILYPTLWYPLILDSLITEINEGRDVSMYSLPKPTRFSGDKVKDIKVTGMGKLIIETEFEMEHQFRIGLRKKSTVLKFLRDFGHLPSPLRDDA